MTLQIIVMVCALSGPCDKDHHFYYSDTGKAKSPFECLSEGQQHIARSGLNVQGLRVVIQCPRAKEDDALR